LIADLGCGKEENFLDRVEKNNKKLLKEDLNSG